MTTITTMITMATTTVVTTAAAMPPPAITGCGGLGAGKKHDYIYTVPYINKKQWVAIISLHCLKY
jgi:hypothetical protein